MEKTKIFLKPVIDLQSTGTKIRFLRKKSGYTVRDIQLIFGFEYPQAVYAWEQGKSIPTIDNLLILSKLFGVAIEDIVMTRNVEIDLAVSNERTWVA